MSTRVVLTGPESALLVAALFGLSEWPFFRAVAKDYTKKVDREEAQALSERLSLEWRTYLESLGLWNDASGRWTDDLIRRRASLGQGIVLDNPRERVIAALALRATALEFADDWEGFCTCLPGSVDRYPLEHGDLEVLARKIEEFGDECA